jgi:hypothetical protein
MESNIEQDREQAHALLDLLPTAKVGAVRNLLELMIDEDTDEGALSPALRQRLIESRAYIASGGRGTPMEEVLAEFGLTMDDFPQPT